MSISDVDSDNDASREKQKKMRLCFCCVIKDYSPLGLLGIILITAGFIIAIYDAKDALPDTVSPYVLVLGMVLILLGVICIVIAFMGYRHIRALTRETNGKNNRRRGGGKREAFWTVSSNFSSTKSTMLQHFDYNQDINEKSTGPCLVSSHEEYGVFLPENSFYVHGFIGEDNFAFEKSPHHEPILGSPSNHPKSLEHNTDHLHPWSRDNENLRSVPAEHQRSSSDIPYTPEVPSWPELDLPNYVPPNSTTE